MAWDDVVVGEGPQTCMTVTMFKLRVGDQNFSISDNTVIYRLDDVMFGVGMTVYKDTEAGRELTELFARYPDHKNFRFVGADLNDPGTWFGYPVWVREYCEQVVRCARVILLRHVEPGVLVGRVDQFVKSAKADAVREKLRQIRGVLGFD